jgi:hypothetical protein
VYEVNGMLGPGAITRFEHQSGYDIVTGDATAAYGGALSRAQRSLVYLRPNLVLAYDNLASNSNRQWEWNIHALNAMTVLSDTNISIANGTQSLCVDMLAGPPMRFTQTNLFTANPDTGLISWMPQWHGAFVGTSLLGSAEFIALLRVNCTATMASARKTNGVWTVTVGTNTVTISDSGISVQ